MERYKTIIPLETWDRKFIFETFSQREFPYVGITTPVDVTELKKAVKENCWSFYGVMSYAVSMAVHSVSEFKRRVEGKQIVEYDNVDLSFTVLNKANNCNFADMSLIQPTSNSFCVCFQNKNKKQKILCYRLEKALLPVFMSLVCRGIARQLLSNRWK